MSDLNKYKLPMDELPRNIKKSIKKNIQELEFPGFENAYKVHKETVFKNGIYRNQNKEMLVTCITEMPEVTPRMIDWWFGWHLNESERYQLWHPKAHISASLKEDNSHFETDKEKYLNMDSYISEYIGNELNDLCISFVEPKQFGFSDLNDEKETEENKLYATSLIKKFEKLSSLSKKDSMDFVKTLKSLNGAEIGRAHV